MSEITSPRTPSPERRLRPADQKGSLSPEPAMDIATSHGPNQNRNAMTPPPSGQKVDKHAQHRVMDGRQSSLASPPATLRAGPPITSVGLYGEVPTMDSVQHMDEDQLRTLVGELLPALGEARVTAAHSKLQHSLLAIEKEEAAKRAEVEHEATRREVQVLQDGSPTQRHGFSPRSPHASVQRSLQLALAHCRELQGDNVLLEKRLRASKKLIAQLHGENVELKDRVGLLRQRIKANREHLNEMQSSGAISLHGTPTTDFGTPRTKATPRTPATSRPIRDLDQLLIAGQILNGEATSVPSTPSPIKPRSAHSQHMRGAHSLSSLPSTPNRSRPMTADNNLSTPLDHLERNGRVSFSAPGTQVVHEESRERTDRDSTISASENEDEVYREEEIAGSQASQRATSMLRRSLGASHDGSITPAPNSGKLLQGKLTGQVKKPGLTREEFSPKRVGDGQVQDAGPRSNKKAKLTGTREKVGLGIQDWTNSGR